MSRSQRLVPLLAALGLYGMSMAGGLVMPRPVQARTQGAMELKLRRSQDSIEVVIEGVGPQPVLQQRQSGQSWEGQLRTQGTPGLRRGPQQVSMPEFGLQSVSLSGSGESYQLKVEGVAGRPMLEPVVSADGRNLILTFSGLAGPTVQTGRLDLQTPGRVPQAAYVPPLRQRAVAPPLGDMAVGTMVLSNRSFVQVSGPPVTLTLNNAPAKDALMSIARLGGYGFIYVGDDSESGTSTEVEKSGTAQVNSGDKKVSMAFQNESYARALNGVLLASGLQGKLEGRTLLVGSAVASKTFGPQVSKIYRLNQTTSSAAAEYLASLGASISKVNTTTITSGEPSSAGTSQLSNQTSQERSTLTEIETYGASVGPLRGLTGTSDTRLNTITLVGDSQLVAVAESYLKQIDLRQRQVALSVKILDVNLDNEAAMANSFAFRTDNMFIVNNNGQLLANFGSYKPPGNELSGQPGTYSGQEGTLPMSGTGTLTTGSGFIDDPSAETPFSGATTTINGQPVSLVPRPGFGTFDNPMQPGITEVDEEGEVTFEPPTNFQYPVNQLFTFIKASIQSSTTKLLASPTLILQEGDGSVKGPTDGTKISEDGKIGREKTNEAYVRVGTQHVTSHEIREGQNGEIFCVGVLSNAGLTFGARVDRIDDNGFVTFSISPEVSAVVGTQPGSDKCGPVTLINDRILDTGKIRVRDGQTLILTGVISDSDRQTITKWPILGDIPLIGQFFRSTSGKRNKRELVILVTPRILNDDHGGAYGYGYKPSTDAARGLIYNGN
ncbi:MAG TPA: hypothetical protein ACN46M_06420 [Prochlorococcus sp.]